MSLLKQPWFLIFLILVGIYSYSSLFESPAVSLSVSEAQAGGKKAQKANKNGKTQKIKLSQSLESKTIDTLKIDGFEAMNIDLKTTKRNRIFLKLEGRGKRHLNSGESFSDWLQVRVSNGILKISPVIEETNMEFADLFKGNEDLTLTIRYPEGHRFTDVEVLTISGNIDMNGTFAKDIRLKSVSGDVEFNKVSCKNLTVEAVSSDLDLTSIFAANVTIKTVSGDATITSTTELPSYTFKSVSGDLDLKLPKSAQVAVDFKSMTGELVNQFTNKSETAGSIEVSSMSGSAEITKIQ